MKTIIVIPARSASTRLPRKMLLSETGKSLIQHTYETASTSRLAEQVVVATDDEEIRRTVSDFGGQAIMTRPDHPSGTDRVAEVAERFPDCQLVINLQGDEPELPGEVIDQLIRGMASRAAGTEMGMGTVASPLRDISKIESPDCVKVVLDQSGQALYFSRAVIPYPREGVQAWLADQSRCFLQHIGLYAYRPEILKKLVKLPPSAAEKTESLEQLRALQAGIGILVEVVPSSLSLHKGIDTAEDYAAFVKRTTKD